MPNLPELLAPAGGPASLCAAVAAGADAVYLGFGQLNARVSAHGFTEDELARSCALAHEHGVRVYAALNVFVFDSEIPLALETARTALKCGVDALIVADLGLVSVLRQELPDAEIHLSTQSGAHAPEAVRLVARELGVGRVTVARELSVPEIAGLCATGTPIEVFCHGAICISYSGACAFSALTRGRSAMRGDCTQPCRANHALVDVEGRDVAGVEGEKLLCPRDYLGIGHVAELCRAGVASLKIEGRMKNPDYVYNVVGAYRSALDAVVAGREPDVPALTERLAHSFNRGFTDIYPRGAKPGAELMSFERSINQGARVGQVVACRRDEIDVYFDAPVHEGDTLEVRFYPGENAAADAPKRWPMLPCPADVAAGETVPVHCKRRVELGSEVYLTRDARLLEQAKEAVLALDPGLAADYSQKKKGAGSAAKEHKFESAGVSAVATLPEELLLDEMLRPDNRAETVLKICSAKQAGRLPVCRNLAQIELCREVGLGFDVAAPIFCANDTTETLLTSWGARTVYRPDELTGTLGGAELMVMDHCVLTAEGPCGGECAACERRAQERFLVEPDGRKLRICVDAHGRTRIYLPAQSV